MPDLIVEIADTGVRLRHNFTPHPNPNPNPKLSGAVIPGLARGGCREREGGGVDAVLQRCLETAVVEARVEAEVQQGIDEVMREARALVADRLALQYGREEALHARVRAQVRKSHESRRRITTMRQEKQALTEACKAEKNEKRDVALSMFESHTSSLQNARAEAASERQVKIISDRKERQQRVEEEVFRSLHTAEAAMRDYRERQVRVRGRVRGRIRVSFRVRG